MPQEEDMTTDTPPHAPGAGSLRRGAGRPVSLGRFSSSLGESQAGCPLEGAFLEHNRIRGLCVSPLEE